VHRPKRDNVCNANTTSPDSVDGVGGSVLFVVIGLFWHARIVRVFPDGGGCGWGRVVRVQPMGCNNSHVATAGL